MPHHPISRHHEKDEVVVVFKSEVQVLCILIFILNRQYCIYVVLGLVFGFNFFTLTSTRRSVALLRCPHMRMSSWSYYLY